MKQCQCKQFFLNGVCEHTEGVALSMEDNIRYREYRDMRAFSMYAAGFCTGGVLTTLQNGDYLLAVIGFLLVVLNIICYTNQ